MDNLCEFSSIFYNGLCFDFWLYRYQTLLVGLLALAVAALQVAISVRQREIVVRQEAIEEKQTHQDQAISKVENDVKSLAVLELDALEAEHSALAGEISAARAQLEFAKAKYGEDSEEMRRAVGRQIGLDQRRMILERAISLRRTFDEDLPSDRRTKPQPTII